MDHQDWETYIIHCKNENKDRDTDKKRKDKEVKKKPTEDSKNNNEPGDEEGKGIKPLEKDKWSIKFVQ